MECNGEAPGGISGHAYTEDVMEFHKAKRARANPKMKLNMLADRLKAKLAARERAKRLKAAK